ncbi:heterokaryon incompatibility protein-domain-containing protein [Coniochaeta sp. 2T2.1]|nr:heterokaryon incompatibility protein-domain-containing protein [Coniochaeta sp. 2T2.1]
MYEPLDRSRREIRLIRVIRGSNDGPISCSLETVSLDDEKLDFAALSYVCGDESITKDIMIAGVVRPVTTNLEAALRNLWDDGTHHTDVAEEHETLPDDVAGHFRWRFGDRLIPRGGYRGPSIEVVHQQLRDARVSSTTFRASIGQGTLPIWVDSLCINQGDLVEKSHQIQFMRHIYASAKCVVSRLGPSDGTGVDLGLRLIRRVAPYLMEKSGLRWTNHIHELKLPPVQRGETPEAHRKRYWKGVKKFNGSEYFTRLWIFQELWAAKQGFFICGGEHLPFAHLRRWVDWAVACKEKPAYNQATPKELFRIKLPSFATFQMISGESDSSSITPKKTFLEVSRHHRCKNPRDKVYALLGPFPFELKPDYSKPVADVYADWATNPNPRIDPGLLLNMSGLGLFPQSWTDPNVHAWLPNLQLLHEQLLDFVPKEVPRSPTSFIPTVSLEDGLTCFGIQMAEVLEVPTRALKAPQPPSTGPNMEFHFQSDMTAHYLLFRILEYLVANRHQLCSEPYPTMGSRLGALILSLVAFADHSPSLWPYLMIGFGPLLPSDGDDVPQSHMTLTQQQVEQLGFSSEEAVWKCWDELPGTGGHPLIAEREHELVNEMMADIMDVAMQRSIIHLSDGFVGVGPPLTEPGDLVYLVHGSHLPVLLRKVDGKLHNVGTCYVHGVSGNDGFKILKDRETEVVEINIV